MQQIPLHSRIAVTTMHQHCGLDITKIQHYAQGTIYLLLVKELREYPRLLVLILHFVQREFLQEQSDRERKQGSTMFQPVFVEIDRLFDAMQNYVFYDNLD